MFTKKKTHDSLHCGICGVLTPAEDQHGTSRVMLRGVEPDDPNERRLASSRGFFLPVPYTVTRCGACAVRRAEAERIVKEQRGRIGVGEFVFVGEPAVTAVENVLAAGVFAKVKINTDNSRQVALAVEYLAGVAIAVPFRSRLEEEPKKHKRLAERLAWIDPKARPYAHVDTEVVSAIRRAWVEYSRARTEKPMPLVPFEAAGCWLCGIGSVIGVPSAAASAWHSVRVNPFAFGGPMGTGRVSVEVCAPCYEVRERVGSWGRTLVDTLVLNAAGLGNFREVYELQLDETPVWGMSGRKQPNSEPWGHLDLVGLAESIRAGVQTGAFSEATK